ncbi:DUF4142 domain-containing protein [Streptomyces sp. NPDC059786]|uniref:DUF4142 domain-containing protein n=1 Tax=Streptomyces sp. NPDC059786 TaxID=3346946 RepID=UPI003652407D
MPRRILVSAAVAVALAGVSVPQAFAADVSDQDSTFLMKVHQGNLTEIMAGQDTRSHAMSDCVKKVGEVLVRDHTKLDSDGKTLAGKLGVTLPRSPSAEQREQLAAVQEKAGSKAYDQAWLTAQAAAHRTTLQLIDQELADGTNAEAMAAARTARPVVAMHLDMVRDGVCHAARDAGTVRAGSGGHLAAVGGSSALGAAGMAGGGLLAVAGMGRLAYSRRRAGQE